MSLISGLLSVQNADPDDLTGEWQQHITVRHAKGVGSGAVLFALLTMLRKENAEANEFHWFERNPVRNDYFSDNNYSSSVTPIGFNDGQNPPGVVWPGLTLNTVLENGRTGEYVRVTADATSSAVTVERGHAGTVAAAINLGDDWTRIATTAEEGSAPTTSIYETPDEMVNYIMTFNSSVFLTNAYKGSVLRTDLAGPLRERRLYALEKISGDIEKSFLLGRRNRIIGTTNGAYIYQTGGIRDALVKGGYTANILNGGGSTGCSLASSFLPWLQSFMVYGSPSKLALCGPSAFAAVSNFANSAAGGFRIMNNETVFGMNITTIVTPFGILELTFHPLLQESNNYQGAMFVIDLPNVVQKVMEPLFLEPNVQTPGQDAYKEQFRAKLGLKLKFAQAFGYANNLTKITSP